MIPYEQFRWIAESFPYPNAQEQKSFDEMCCNLVNAHVKTVLWPTPERIFVVTWSSPATPQ